MEISIFEELLRKKLLNAKVHGRVWSGKKLLMATLTKCSSSLPYTMAVLNFFFFNRVSFNILKRNFSVNILHI